MNLLRSYIKTVLSEAANRDFTNLGLFMNDQGNTITFTLYDAATFVQQTKANKRLTFDDSMVKGTIQLRKDPGDGACHNAWQVIMVAAVSGYGPTMYDIALAMVDSHTIMPDRASVSDSALGVWSYFKNKRGDVEALKLDTTPKGPQTGSEPLTLDDDPIMQHLLKRTDGDIEKQQKPQQPGEDKNKEDDCFSVHFKNKDILDYAYRLKGSPINVAQPMATHDKVATALEKRGLKDTFEKVLSMSSSKLFSKMS